MKSFKIGNRMVGDGTPVYIVFEAGQTHCGFDNAKELIDAAAQAGADAIKFQVYDVDRLISSKEVMDVYEVLVDRESMRRETVREPIMDSLRRHQFTVGQWPELKRYADDQGVTFFATVCFPEEVDLMAELGVHVFKICSGDVDHHPFIRYVAGKGLPVMLDTGTSTIGEVERAVDVIRSEGNEQIVIHHCPGGYPARVESVNLRIIETLRQMFDYPIAFSDHSPGWDMDIAAVALGVDMVEKTITSDRMIRDAEHIMSTEAGEACDMVRAIRDLEIALGRPRREMSEEEWKAKAAKRRSFFANVDLSPGDVLSDSNVDYRRPGTGISPSFYHQVIGKRIARPVSAGTMLTWADLGVTQP